MKNIKQAAAWVCLCLLICCGTSAESMAQNVTPGSEADPVVSKSYVDSKINQLIVMINEQQRPVAQAPDSVDTAAFKREILAELPAAGGAVFMPVYAVKGQIVLGGEGCEIILRSGRAAGYCVGENGMVDATEGCEITHGANIQANHLLLVPRDDGRGVVILSDDAWLIVKGGCQIVNMP